MNRLEQLKARQFARIELQAESMKMQINDWPMALYLKCVDQIDIWMEYEFEKLDAQEEERR